MQLVSWNVNGIRACLRNGFLDFLGTKKPDVVCLQEVKCTPEQVGWELPDYQQFWNPAAKLGYSGTAVLTKRAPIAHQLGIQQKEHDQEGRVLTLEFSDHYLVNVYTPNSQRGLTRLDYRIKWDAAFLSYLKNLEKSKPVIFCGDLNVAHKEIDLANPKSNIKNAGFTPEERARFDEIVKAGFVDAFRHFNKQPGQYTWWTYRNDARTRNIGWRIDYFCVSQSFLPKVKRAEIWQDIKGSDHCPIMLELEA